MVVGRAVARAVVAWAGATLLAGCFGNTTTEFPPGLEPLEDNTAPRQQGGSPQEQLTMVEGRDSDPELDFIFVHGRGYVAADPGLVWALTKDGEMLSSSCRIDSWTVTEDTVPEYEYSFTVRNFVDDIVNVEWDEEWRFGTILGTPEAPAQAMVRYQKVWGSEFIYRIEGSIQVLATDEAGVTELQFIEHLAALSGGASDMRQSMQRRFDSILALAHGGTPPACP
ncbi:MAG: hypothetical protein R2939_09410 [Kofleriaceae bacterium]